MIPSDVASRLQVNADAALRQVAPIQEIADKLSGLVAGQKVMAEIQSMLPNGTYRAMINQRNVTLALPFSAKTGDSLELLVTESDGKLALAVATRPETSGGKTVAGATSTTLSRTGQLISDLFSGSRDTKGSAVTLNGNQPLSSTPPTAAKDLLPLLKQALSQSGLFYEAHQAEWVAGRMTTSALLLEPQGKLSSPATLIAPNTDQPATLTHAQTPPVAAELSSAAVNLRAAAETPLAQNAVAESSKPVSAQQNASIIPQPVQPLVQQQLEALASQSFSWQGQIWPGQEMFWEIHEEAERRGQPEGDETASQWSTRLRMVLPNLGEIDAQIRLQNNQLTLSMSAANAKTREQMHAASLALRAQLAEAGLSLASMGIESLAVNAVDGQAS